MPVGRWVSDKPRKAAPLLAVDLKACHKAAPEYQDMTGIDGMDSYRKLAVIPANRLVIDTHRSLRGLNRCSAGRLVSRESVIGVSGVIAIIRLEAILN